MTEIVNLPISKLSLLEKNPRKIDKDKFEKLCSSLKIDPDFFNARPCLVHKVGDKLEVYAGNQRVKAAKKLKWKEVPCIIETELSEDLIKDRILKDNLHAGDWDYDILANEWDLDVLIAAGFDPEALLGSFETIETTEEDDEALEPGKDEDAITKLGDLFELNEHRLCCGDCLNPDVISLVINNTEIDMVYTDPPYGINVNISDGKQHGNAKTKRNKFNPIINDSSNQTAIDSFNFCRAMNIPTMIWWGANYYPECLPSASCWIVWDKDTSTNNFPDAELAWCNSESPVRIFKHTWNGMIKGSEQGQKRVHPTQKPIALAEWCIKNYAKEAKSVFDLFVGSGSTLIACEKMKKQFFGIELSPAYCDIIVDRWRKFMIKNNKEYSIKLNGEIFNGETRKTD